MREEHDEAHDVGDPPPLVPGLERADAPAVDEAGQRVADEAPLLVARPALERDAEHLGAEAGDADHEEGAEDDGVLGLRLDADAVRALHVAANERPHDAAEEDEPHQVAEGHVAPVHVAVQELQLLGHLVVDLEHGGDTEQAEEPEVDHRVHEAGTGVAQQRLHVDAGPEVLEPLRGVLGRGPALSRCAALPVLHPVREHDGHPHEQHRDDGVERDLDRTGDVDEHRAVGEVVVLPAGDLREDARHDREQGDRREQDQRELMRLDALGGRVGGGFDSSAHDGPKATRR